MIKRIAALDISKNRIGVAFSDEDQSFVAKEITLFTKNLGLCKKQLQKLFKEYQPEITYIGLPYTQDPQTSKNSINYIKTFTHGIRSIIGKFDFVDESLSTFQAQYMINEGIIKNTKDLDSIVARLIILSVINKKI